MNAWRKRATQVSESIYREFLETVVEAYVLKDRVDQQFSYIWSLPEKKVKAITAGKEKNPRPVRLMTLSGKGGWSNDPEKCLRYLHNTNITLLDHLLSVVRGALMMAALDWLARNPDMDEAFLYRKLRLIAVLGFMHDLDKDLNLGSRIYSVDDVNNVQVAERMQRYGLDKYLKKADIELTPDQLLYLIDKVEAQQSNRRLPETLPAAYTDGTLPLYVRLADKLDGIFLDGKPDKPSDKKGIKGVLNRLKEDISCIRSEELRRLFTNGRLIDIYDPHHPFLLDELQKQLALQSRELVGAPPLIEIHHDGRLLVLLYEEQVETVIENALATVCISLPFSLRLNINTRGEPELLNGQPTHKELNTYLANIKHSDLKNLLMIKAEDVNDIFNPLAEMMQDLGLTPNLPLNYNKNVSLYDSDLQIQGNAKIWLRRVAHAALLMNLNLKNTPKNFPDYNTREQAFLQLLPETPPPWISNIKYGHGRRVLTALWAAALAIDDSDLKQIIWGDTGLLQQWLEGTNETPAFRQFIPAESEMVSKAVKDYFQQRLQGLLVNITDDKNPGSDENSQEYCHFTAQPVPKTSTSLVIKDNLGLGKIGVRASAFNGRDNRPEGLNDGSHTRISPISLAEYTLRTEIYKAAQNNKDIDMPTLLSSPTTLGLFGSLALESDNSIRTVALRDLTSVEPGRLDDLFAYKGRCRIARFESFAGNTEAQIYELFWLLQAVLRLGRPIHIFRGLPVHSRAFFYFDALPEWLGELMHESKNRQYLKELRLEQIPYAIERLELAQVILRTNNLGYDVLRLYAVARTRFMALCRIWLVLQEESLVRREVKDKLLAEYFAYTKGEAMNDMNKSDKVLVEFAQQAARIQTNRGASAAMRKQLQVLDLCLEFMTVQRKHSRLKTNTIEDRQALQLGIAGWLEDNLTRRKDVASKHHWQTNNFKDACLAVAKFFIETVWPEVLENRIPSLERLRNIKSIYRMAFIQCYQPKPKDKGDDTPEVELNTIQAD